MTSGRDRLVDSLYSVVENPDRLGVLFENLSGYCQFSAPSKDAKMAGTPSRTIKRVLENLKIHFDRASSLMDLAGRGVEGMTHEPSMASVEIGLLVGADGRVGYPKADATPPQALRAGDRIFALNAEAGDLARLRVKLRSMSGCRRDEILMAVPAYDCFGKRCLLAFTPVQIADGPLCARVSKIELDWSAVAGGAISRTFKLTEIELGILRAICQGHSLADHARERNRSLATVRTQAKLLFEKTGAHSQVELVRMFAAFSQKSTAGPVDFVPPRSAQTCSRRTMIDLPDGRTAQVDMAGAPHGTPVLFLHGVLSGTGIPEQMDAYLKQTGIRLIAPLRPGFGQSTNVGCEPNLFAETYVSDIAAILDRLSIDEVRVLGHRTGAAYAIACAEFLPSRVSRVFIVSATLPHSSATAVHDNPSWQSMFAQTALYAPSALTVLAKGAAQLAHAQRLDRVLTGLYGGAEVDADTIVRPEIFRTLEYGFHAAFAQGTLGYERDLRVAVGDWCDGHFLEASNDVTFIHGSCDPVTSPDLIRQLCSSGGHLDLTCVQGAGQLLLYQHTPLVLDIVGGRSLH